MFLNFLRQNFYFVLGSLLGLSLSLIIVPILENNRGCIFQFKSSEKNQENIQIIGKINDEYEPLINLAGKPLKAQKIPQSFIRPRYFSTELGIKQKLLVGVLCDSNSIETNSIAINKTIAHLTEKILYFVDTPNKLNISKLNMPDIVSFIDSRHILKPFHIFKYLIDNYIQEFDFFFLVNDSSYVNLRKLYHMVNRLSISEPLYLGVRHEIDAYCSLNTGILLSNSVLNSLSNNIDWCIKNIDSDLNDVNIARCIKHSAQMECTSSMMGQKYSSFNIIQNTNVKYELQYLKKQHAFNNAITVHPIIKENYFYILHSYFTKVGLERDLTEVKQIRQSIELMSSKFSDLKRNLTWPVGNQPGNKPRTRFDVLSWKYFTYTSLYQKNDYTTLSEHSLVEQEDIYLVVNSSIEFINYKYAGKLKFVQLLNGYKKFDVSRGIDYVLDLEFKNIKNKILEKKRIQICKPLGNIDILKIPYVTEGTRINIVLPVTHIDVNITLKFLAQYRRICMEKKEKTFLMLVLLYEPNLPGKDSKHDVYKQIKEKAKTFTKDYKRDGIKVAWLSIKLPKKSHLYSYLNDQLLNFAILDLALKKLPVDSLVFFTSPYIEFHTDFLNRIRMNTINGYQVYHPVPFSEYSPNITQQQFNSIDINKNIGHFNIYNKEHISFYVRDYNKAREKHSKRIPYVHLDKDILNLTQRLSADDLSQGRFVLDNVNAMFEDYGNVVHLMKAIEPSLRVFYKQSTCDLYTSDGSWGKRIHEQCVFLRNYNLGSRSQLSKSVLQYISKLI